MSDRCFSSHSNKDENSIESYHVPFKLHWVFGYDTKVPPINISSSTIKGIFFSSGAVGVCYDWNTKTQTMLHGHIHPIISSAATSDKTYLATADGGPENSLIIWHRRTGKMVFVLSNHFPVEGVIFMCFSEDGIFLLTLTGGKRQELSLWNWKTKSLTPHCTFYFTEENTFQHFASFHPKDASHFLSCSKENVYIFKMLEGKLKFASLDLSSLYEEKACRQIGNFTQTVFCTTSPLVYTATTKGMIILWGSKTNSKKKPDNYTESLMMEPTNRTCVRAMQILASRCSISYLGSIGSFLVVGTAQGQVCYFNKDLQLEWSIDVTKDEICSVSFNFKPRFTFKQVVYRALGKDVKKDDKFSKNDFIACTKNGFVGYVSFSTLSINEILFGTSSFVKDVALHPLKPYMYLGDCSGGLKKWNYESKTLLNKCSFKNSCPQIECLSIDSKGTYIACALVSGEVVIFDAISFSGKPCFTAHDIQHKIVFIKFSPDPQHLVVTDAVSNVFRYQLHLLVPPTVYQLMQKRNVPPEEPSWSYNGKTRQHRGQIVDCMFNNPSQIDALYFLSLGQDRLVGRLHVYNIETEEIIKMVTVPSFKESYQKMMYLENKNISQDPSFQFVIFHTLSTIGLAKFPIDGNLYSVLAIASHPNGINSFVTNNESKFIFTAGKKDSWIYMYEIDFMALIKSGKGGLSGIDAFKHLFPTNRNSEEMKKNLIFSVYALELEIKMLQLGAYKQPILKGEIPVNCLEYVMAALGCYLSPEDLQMMLRDVHFENKYVYSGDKSTLNCFDIMRLYVNYRPKDPLTMENVHQSFKDFLLENGDPDEISRDRFLSILESEGDSLPTGEFLHIVRCLRENKFKTLPEENISFGLFSDNTTASFSESSEDSESSMIKKFIPEVITEDIFFQDILCIEQANEDLSKYVLREEDYKLREEPLSVEEFVLAMEESKLVK
ncbi:hypothetical protein JTE90_026114 [Oedothorax gibbosus]|uniref:Cilia- and flagella-associated protein 251 n=1 Tax=Oedothorax gibbosus TaxID=931172 RepID=A0AAV6V1Q9_9ARAC|nr:hypothetical protein JTE90_026114 [Oedothorax gibbosus]